MKITKKEFEDFLSRRTMLHRVLEEYFIEFAEETGVICPEKYEITEVYRDGVEFEWDDYYCGESNIYHESMPIKFIFDREGWREDHQAQLRHEEMAKLAKETREQKQEKWQLKELMEKYPEDAKDILGSLSEETEKE